MGARTLKRVDSIARALSRSRAWVINEAVERYLDYEEWFVGEVVEGLKEAAAGEVVDHGEVVREWERAAKVDTRRRRDLRLVGQYIRRDNPAAFRR